MILGLLRDKAIAADQEHAAAFDLALWKHAGSFSCGYHDVFRIEEDGFCYDREALISAFLDDSDALEAQFTAFCLDAFYQKYGAGNEKDGFCSSGGGHGGTHGIGHGREAGADQQAAVLSRRDGADYRTLLHRFCVSREEMIPDLDSFDYIFYLYGQGVYADRRLCLIEPLEYSEVNRLDELAIAIDTSGSCSGELVRRFLEETWSILRQRENFFSRMRLHLIQCDSMIQEHRIFTSVEEWEAAIPDLKIQGNGSTDFRPVFELLDTLIAKKEIRTLRALLYFTDGDGIYPRKAPPYETAFVFVNRESVKGKTPEWVQRIILDNDP